MTHTRTYRQTITMAHAQGQHKRGSSTAVQFFTGADACYHFAYQDYSLNTNTQTSPPPKITTFLFSKDSDTAASTVILTKFTVGKLVTYCWFLLLAIFQENPQNSQTKYLR